LARARDGFRVVVLHHPPFSCAGYLGDNTVRTRWVPLFKRYHVDLVLAGHDRNYQRFVSGSVTYVVSGGMSAEFSRLQRCPPFYPRRRFAKSRSALVYLRASPTSALVTALDASGRTLDQFRVK
jgi:hypothetical protein